MAQRTDPDNPVIPRSIQSGAQLRKWYEDHRDSRALILKAETIRPSGAPKIQDGDRLPDLSSDLVPIYEMLHFQNWAKTVAVVVHGFKPTCVQDVKSIVQYAKGYNDRAKKTGKPKLKSNFWTAASKEVLKFDVFLTLFLSRYVNLQVRACGTAHSFSPIFTDANQILIFMDDMRIKDDCGKMRKVIYDSVKQEVTVSAGATNQDLLDEIGSEAYLESNVILKVVQLTGLTPTGSHGTGWNQQSVSDVITEMRVVTGDANETTFNSAEDLKAVGISLGLFGITTQVTLKVQPVQQVRVRDEFDKTFKQVFQEKKQWEEGGKEMTYVEYLYERDFSLEIFWFPFNSLSLGNMSDILCCCPPKGWNPDEDRVWVRRITKHAVGSEEPSQHGDAAGNIWDKVWDFVYNQVKNLWDAMDLGITKPVSLFLQYLAPVICYAFYHIIKFRFVGAADVGEKVTSITDAIHFVDPYASPFTVYDLEMAFNCPRDCATVLRATQIVKDMVADKAKSASYPMTNCMEMRFIGDTSCLLSPSIVCAKGKEPKKHTAYIEVLSNHYTKGLYESFFEGVAQAWCDSAKKLNQPEPILHWAKEWMVEDVGDYFRRVYGENMCEFKKVREAKSKDDHHMFVTSELNRIFEFYA